MKFMVSTTIMVMVIILTTTIQLTHGIAKESDTQILLRVIENLKFFLNEPIDSINRMVTYRKIGGFPGDLHSADLNTTSKFLFKEVPLILYYGLEDGTCIIYNEAQAMQTPRPGILHRQPGFSGYPTDPVPENFMKHWIACVDDSGHARNCTLPEGSLYVKCIDDCKLEKCDTVENSLLDCSQLSMSEEDRADCEASITWCQQYRIETVQAGEKLGTVPSMFSCVNQFGSQEQTPGRVLVGVSYEEKELGNCYFLDGETLVNRSLIGNYDSCGEEETCNPFIGTYMTPEYDPRYRPWYIQTKRHQRPLWTDPYPFFGLRSIGITYTEPIYTMQGSKKVFKGVLAVDYTFGRIHDFLSQFQGSEIFVLVVEAEAPNYVVEVSTGSVVTKSVSKADPTKPCSDHYDTEACTVVRMPLEDLDDDPTDIVLREAFEARAAAGFPVTELVLFKRSKALGDRAYISRGDILEHPKANLKWHVIVAISMQRNTQDAAYVGSTSFYVIIITSIAGFIACMIFFTIFFGFRKKAAFQNKDWAFTCAFIFGCSLLNLSSLTLLGENRDELCMLRMWSFNLLFATALSPLFVKVWRMHKLLHASSQFKRVTITNFTAMLYTLPIISVEVFILMIFSVLDPPKAAEELGVANLEFGQVQEITCQHETNTFFQTQVVFDAILVLLGCYLALETRNLDPRFGEAKQLGLTMYNIAFTGIILILITRLVEMDETIQLLLQAIGVAWGTVFNSAAFVAPKLYEVQRQNSKRIRRSSVHYGKTFIQQGQLEVLVEANNLSNFSSSCAAEQEDASGRTARRDRDTSLIPNSSPYDDDDNDNDEDNGNNDDGGFISIKSTTDSTKVSATEKVIGGGDHDEIFEDENQLEQLTAMGPIVQDENHDPNK